MWNNLYERNNFTFSTYLFKYNYNSNNVLPMGKCAREYRNNK